LEFEVGDHVYLLVFPLKGVSRFSIKGKLAFRYISSYPIIDKYGPMSYQVELPMKLSAVHNVFHISQLKRCLKPLSDVVIEVTIPLEPDLTYKAHPIKVLDQQDRVTRNKTTPTDVVIEDTIPLEPDLTYKTHSIKVFDQQDRVTCNKTTRFYKIQWNDHSKDEATWEHKEFL
jgi:hypothetical protein